jgi:Fe-S-cluster-containing dehydrogenase component
MRRKFLFDQNKCVGCTSCVLACKNEFQTPPEINYRTVRPANENPQMPERVFVNFACAHCDDPACLSNCPVSAYRKRSDGVVQHDVDQCIGCKLCTVSCPYGTPKYNKAVGKVYKCQFCYQRLDKGLLPMCVQGCPVGALAVVDIDTGTAMTSLGTVNVENAVASIAELPSNDITKPNHRFILRKAAKQIRYDSAG